MNQSKKKKYEIVLHQIKKMKLNDSYFFFKKFVRRRNKILNYKIKNKCFDMSIDKVFTIF